MGKGNLDIEQILEFYRVFDVFLNLYILNFFKYYMRKEDLHWFCIFFIISLFLLFFIRGTITGNVAKIFFAEFKNGSIIQTLFIDDPGDDTQKFNDAGDSGDGLGKENS